MSNSQGRPELPLAADVNPTPILALRGITKIFPGVKALTDVSFDCRRGEVHALVGENGAGKSTLLKIISGAYRPDAGHILVNGKQVQFHHPREAQKYGISIIYQEFNLLSERTIAQNIFLGREPMRGLVVDQAAMLKQTTDLLEGLGVDIDPRAQVSTLRVAQQQIVEIAKAMSLNADVVLMDEPTAALSLNEVDALLALVKRLQERGITIIYISHRLEEVFRIADRVTVLKDGQIVDTKPITDVTQNELVNMMVGRELSHYYPPRAKPGEVGAPILEVRDLNVNHWLHDVTFEVRRGEILGIAGLEGSGRTFLARSLFGAEKVTGGEIELEGKRLRFRQPIDAIRAGIGFITEDRKGEGLALIMSIRRNMTLPSLDMRQFLGFIRARDEAEVVRELSSSLELRAASENTEVQYLSGGNQQKVVLAKWLATQAKLLIFDEPTRGIDVGAKAGIHQLIRQMAGEGVGVIMISSELPEVLGMSDRILVMRQGTLVAEFPGAEATETGIMQAATGTTAALPKEAV